MISPCLGSSGQSVVRRWTPVDTWCRRPSGEVSGEPCVGGAVLKPRKMRRTEGGPDLVHASQMPDFLRFPAGCLRIMCREVS